MNKTVFRPNEFTSAHDKVLLKLSHFVQEEEPEEILLPDEPLFEGPTADDLRREADMFRVEWEVEKQQMIDEAKTQAEQIIKEAEDTALYEVKSQTEQIQALKADSENEAKNLVEKAKQDAERIINDATASQEAIISDSKKEGLEAGNKEGYEAGYAEAMRVTERLHAMIEKVMEKRKEILQETEQQVIDLVLLMTRKVVKVLSTHQEEVVAENIKEALKKVKTRGD
ncbi:MAG: flagellar assembly protein FliH, partial [Treponemataceae bacterium]